MGVREADAVIERYLARAQALITLGTPQGRRAAQEILILLVAADASLARRLAAWNALHGGGDMRFTEASMLAYRSQMADVLVYVKARLAGITETEAMNAARTSAVSTSRLFATLEHEFTGIAIPLRLDEATVMRLRPSLLARHATSVDRYGMSMINVIQQTMAQGFVEGVSQHEMTNRLVRMGGPRGLVSVRATEVSPNVVLRLAEEDIPEGLFVRHRYWAERIVRTEVAEAQNAVNFEAIGEGIREFPDMKKKILAVMDKRTAWDSIGVHGQVKAENENFRDGAGREYLRPPARPNDRETIIPWRTGRPDTEHSRELMQTERDMMWERNERWQTNRARRRAQARRKET